MILKDVKQKFNIFYNGIAEINFYEEDKEGELFIFYIKRDGGKDYWEIDSEEGVDYDKYIYDINIGKVRNQNNLFSKYLENTIAERI